VVVEGADPPTNCLTHKTTIIIMAPLMLAAVAIATIPVLYHPVREDRLVLTGSADRARPVADTGYSRRTVRGTDSKKVAA
jgi:hypothetical protein